MNSDLRSSEVQIENNFELRPKSIENLDFHACTLLETASGNLTANAGNPFHPGTDFVFLMAKTVKLARVYGDLQDLIRSLKKTKDCLHDLATRLEIRLISTNYDGIYD